MTDANHPAPPNTPLGAGFETTVTRVFKAPRKLVFECFTDPVHFAKWWGPLTCENTLIDFEPRPGGALKLRMKGLGFDHVMGGEFIEVSPIDRLVFLTKAFEAPDGGWGIINRNTLTFEDAGADTKITSHIRVERAEGELVLGALGGLRAGWAQSLERLGDLVGGGGKMDLEVSDRKVVTAQAFDAPPERIWQALTDPALFGQWWISGAGKVEEMDVRPGGKWAFRTEAGGLFWGEYTAVEPSTHLALTQGFDNHPAVPVVYELKAQWGRTTLTRTMTFPDNAYRDGLLSSGFEPAAAAGFEALARVVAG